MDTPDPSTMTPEQIQEYQRKQCIFCHIVSGRIPAQRVFEDEKVLCLLDIKPAQKGHIIILPKEHYSVLPQVPDTLIQHLGRVAQQMSRLLIRALKCTGTTLLVANGIDGGQQAPHVLFHVIPRFDNDGLAFTLPSQKQDLVQFQQRIAPAVLRALGASERVQQTPVKKSNAELNEKELNDNKDEKNRNHASDLQNEEEHEEITEEVEQKQSQQHTYSEEDSKEPSDDDADEDNADKDDVQDLADEKTTHDDDEGGDGVNLDDITNLLT